MHSDKQEGLLFKRCYLLAAPLTKYIFVNALKEFKYHIVIVYFITQHTKQNNIQFCMLLSANCFSSSRFFCSLELN